MKINLNDLTDKIEKQDYIQDLATVKYADISHSKTKLKAYAAKMVKEVAAALQRNSLVQTQLAVTGRRPVTFALEANIINLPYANYKRIANFFEKGKDYEIKVYFETISDYVNVSHFRIDQLATVSEISQQEEAVVDKLTAAMQEKLKIVQTYKKPAKKTTAKKTRTSARKARTRRTRTRKSTRKTRK